MEQEKLNEILQAHKKWLDSNGEEGARADLRGANLRDADLRDANLRYANLRCANLRHANLCRADLRNANLYDANLYGADLCRANLRGTDLCHADLRYADMRDTDLRGADLRGADLRDADLCDADLCDADIDYAALPLWCGGLHMHVDDRIGIQLLYHAVANILFSKNTSVWLKKSVSFKTILRVVNKFHRVDECGKVEPYCEVKPNEKP